MQMSDILLSVEALAATYHHTIRALSGVSFDVRRGEIVALLGANGAGKSTTLKAVSNLLHAERGQVTEGQVHFDGAPSPRFRRRTWCAAGWCRCSRDAIAFIP